MTTNTLRGRSILYKRSGDRVKRKPQKEVTKWFWRKCCRALANGRHYRQSWVVVSIGGTLAYQISKKAIKAASAVKKRLEDRGHQVITENLKRSRHEPISVITLDILVGT